MSQLNSFFVCKKKVKQIGGQRSPVPGNLTSSSSLRGEQSCSWATYIHEIKAFPCIKQNNVFYIKKKSPKIETCTHQDLNQMNIVFVGRKPVNVLIFIIYLFIEFFETVFLHSSGLSEIRYVAQAGLALVAILLFQPPQCWAHYTTIAVYKCTYHKTNKNKLGAWNVTQLQSTYLSYKTLSSIPSTKYKQENKQTKRSSRVKQ